MGVGVARSSLFAMGVENKKKGGETWFLCQHRTGKRVCSSPVSARDNLSGLLSGQRDLPLTYKRRIL